MFRFIAYVFVAGFISAVPAIASLPHDHVIYVSARDGVSIYSERYGQTPIGRITDGIRNPGGLAVDAQGSLYVANYGGRDVLAFPAGASKASMAITQGLNRPLGVGVSRSGMIYVADEGGTVQIYASSGGAPIGSLPVIIDSEYGPDAPKDVAIDHAGNVWVYYLSSCYVCGSFIVEYIGVMVPPVYLNASPSGFALDLDRRGSVVFASEGVPSYGFEQCVCIVAYRPRGPSGSFDRHGFPAWVRLDELEDRAYALDWYDRTLTIFDYPSGRPVRVIQNVSGVNGLAVSPANVL